MLKNKLLTPLLALLMAGALSLVGTTAQAQTASQVSVTGAGTTGTVPNNVATIVDPNLVVSANGNISGFTVTITGSYTNGDILGYTGALPTGITTSGFNTATRSLQFAGTASPTVWQDLLRRVTLRTTSAVCFPEQRKVSFNFGQVFYNILNEHFYQLVSSSTTWTNARINAQNLSYYGYQGYLTTITSAAENSFIQAFTDANSWIGCSDNFDPINQAVGYTLYANQAAAEGKWYWVTGPERGTQMRTGNAANNNLGSNIAGVYQAWSGGEPNDYPGAAVAEEDYGHMYNNNGLWNDFPNGQSIPYLVEYGGMPNDLSTSNVVYTRTLNVNGAPTTGIIGGNTTICSGGNITLSLAPFSGTVVRWEWSTDDFLTAGNAISNTTTTLNVTGLTETRYYRAILNTTSPSCSNLSTSSTVVNVATANGGVINAQSNAICAGGDAVLTLFGNQGSVLDWQRSTASNFSTFTTINSTSTTISNTIGTAGTYYFRARVQNGSCGSPVFSAVYTITVNSGTPPIGGSVSNATHCGGSNAGTLTLSGHTGTIQSWQYSDDFGIVWTTVANTTTSLSYSGITSTRYYRAILQNGSCGTAYSNVGIVTVYNFTASNSGPVCSGTNLQLGVTATGGVGPFTYSWTGPNDFSSSLQNPSISAVSTSGSGTYSVTVSAPGCNTTVTTAVVVNASPTISAVTNNGRCGSGTVVLGATASAGTISWFAASTGGTALSTGTSYTTPSLSSTTSYWVSSTNGSCTTPARSEVIATINTQPTVASSSGGARCGTGTVTLSASASSGVINWFAASTGGTSIGTGASFTTPSISSTTTYWAEANNGGCVSASRTAVVATINAVPSLSTTVTSVSCNGGSNGAASVFASNGVAPYTYSWSPSGGTNSLATGLSVGNYTVTVTGNNSCSSQANIVITQPTALVVNTASQTNVACNGGSNGAASVAVSGGAGGYTYNWTPGNPSGDGSASVTGLSAGTWTCTVTDANGCTSSQSFTINQPNALVVNPISQTNIACNGTNSGAASVSVSGGAGGYTYNWTPGNPTGDGSASVTGLIAGTWVCTVTDINGCTATRSFTITQPNALVVSLSSQSDVSCFGGNNGSASVSVSGGAGGYTYNWSPGNPAGDGTAAISGLTAGTWTCVVTDVNDCQATLQVIISEPNAIASNISATACDSYMLNDETYTASGIYTQVVESVTGCDSTITLNLTILESTFENLDVTACDSYTLNDETYSASGIYTQVLENAAGCDSTITLNLTILESTFENLDVTACDSYTLNDETYSASGIYTQVLENAAGCDSTITLNLTILESTFENLDVTACDSYTLNDETYTASGIYTQVLENAAGCDSTITLNLTILESTFENLDVTACDSYTLNDETYTASGVYTQVLENAAGCDSTITLNLTILESTFENLDVTACDSYTLNDETYTASGIYTQVLENAAGCDSTITLNLTILESTFENLDVTACDSYTLNDETYTASGIYTQVLENAAGCDSTITLNLTILESTYSTLNVTACDSYMFNDELYNMSGEYTQIIQNAAGCDSIITLNLTILESNGFSFDAVACESYMFNDELYTQSGVYTQVLQNAAGCDSTVTLHLTILQNSFENLDIVACDSYELNGETYSESGIYTQLLQNAAGCDSTLTLHLTILQSSSSTLEATACGSYSLIDQTYTESGVYTQVVQNTAGCDSIITLQLTILHGTTEQFNIVAFQSYEVNGNVYDATGEYTYVYEGENGCENVEIYNIIITLVAGDTNGDGEIGEGEVPGDINGDGEIGEGEIFGDLNGDGTLDCEESALLGLLTETLDITSCGSYTFEGVEFIESGVYVQEYINVNGCIVSATLNLDIIQLNAEIVNNEGALVSAQGAGANYQWIDCASGNAIEGANGQIYVPSASGQFALELSLGECVATTECIEFIFVGQEELQQTALHVFPNPSQGMFRVQNLGNTDAKFEVFNPQGAVVMSGRFTNSEHTLNLENYSSGVYLLKVEGQVYRLIIQ